MSHGIPFEDLSPAVGLKSSLSLTPKLLQLSCRLLQVSQLLFASWSKPIDYLRYI